MSWWDFFFGFFAGATTWNVTLALFGMYLKGNSR